MTKCCQDTQTAEREAVLVALVKELLPEIQAFTRQRVPLYHKAMAILADTSPAAESLLAQGERIEIARGKVMMIDASPAGSLNAQLKAEALAALAPGEKE